MTAWGDAPELTGAAEAWRTGNNLGLLRLVLAALVVVSHAPVHIDGTTRREPLTAVFHTLSLGSVAVDGFFLISGFLIADSALRSRSFVGFLKRRVLRIYPAYLVAFLVCIFGLGPFVGLDPLAHLGLFGANMLLLSPPTPIAGQLPGLADTALDGAMWSLKYEFRCYLLVGVLAGLGALGRPRLLTAALAGLAAVMLAAQTPAVRDRIDHLTDNAALLLLLVNGWAMLRLGTVFMLGVLAFVHRGALHRRVGPRTAAGCALLAGASLCWSPSAELGLVVFGGVALFWLAFKARLGVLQAVNRDWDVSYGVYLYGWPIAVTILWFNRDIGPLGLTAATLALAGLAGAASWFLVESRVGVLAGASPSRTPSPARPRLA